MKVHIVADGSAMGVTLIDAETGEPITNVRAVDIHLVVGQVPTATLEFVTPVVDVVAHVEDGD